jgi:hypothetical protein
MWPHSYFPDSFFIDSYFASVAADPLLRAHMNTISSIAISESASGQHELKAAVAGVTYRVLAFLVSAAGTVTAKFQSGNTDITGPFNLIAGVPLGGAAPIVHAGAGLGAICETAPGAALNLNLGGGVAVGGVAILQTVSQQP